MFPRSEVQVTVANTAGNLGKLMFIIPCFSGLIMILKLICRYNELTKNKTSFFCTRYFCNDCLWFVLWYGSFIKLNDNMRYTEYNHSFIHIT